jgi:hypothetical protein
LSLLKDELEQIKEKNTKLMQAEATLEVYKSKI